MQIDKPALIAELSERHALYERALIGNDIDALRSLFWSSPHAVRYGVSENLYGSEEIDRFRQRRPNKDLARDVIRCEIHTFGDSAGVVNLDFVRSVDGILRSGRQSQTWARFEDGWKIVSAHVSLLPLELTYARAASEQIGLRLRSQDLDAVEQEFSRIAGQANVMLQFQLDESIEPAPVFRP